MLMHNRCISKLRDKVPVLQSIIKLGKTRHGRPAASVGCPELIR
jgi:hypothetical protein